MTRTFAPKPTVRRRSTRSRLLASVAALGAEPGDADTDGICVERARADDATGRVRTPGSARVIRPAPHRARRGLTSQVRLSNRAADASDSRTTKTRVVAVR